MQRRINDVAFGVASLAVLLVHSSANYARSEGTYEKAIEGLHKHTGFITLYWTDTKGQILMELDRLNEELLYQVAISAGVGINGDNLDRGQLGDTRVVIFRRLGDKIALEQVNVANRA